MARTTISTEPIQVARYNPKRFSIGVQFLPSSIVPGNTGAVYGKWGSAPKADINSNTWDFVLNSGAADGSNVDESQPQAARKEDLWLIADTADQQVNVVEHNVGD